MALSISGHEARVAINGMVVDFVACGGAITYRHPGQQSRFFELPPRGEPRDAAFWKIADAVAKDFGREGDEQSTGTLKDMLEDFFGTEAN